MTQDVRIDQYISAQNKAALDKLDFVDRCLVERNAMSRFGKEYHISSYSHLESINRTAFFERIITESLKPEALQSIRDAENKRVASLFQQGQEDLNRCALKAYQSNDIRNESAGNPDRLPNATSIQTAPYIDL